MIVFFVATSTFQQEERDAEVNLPGSSVGPMSAVKSLVINVRKDGTVSFGTMPSDLTKLRDLVQNALKEDPSRKILIRGDRETPHGHVADAVHACYAAGANKAQIVYDHRVP